MSDPYSSIHCDWCGKYMINKEAQTKIVSNVTYTLCEFCFTFDSQAAMQVAKALIVANAINPELSEQYGYPWL
jgi:hypothetical protein